MCRKQRDGQPVDAEGDAGGVRGLQVGAGKTPGRSEVIAMIVEAHAGGRRFRRSNRHQHLEFQRLRDLEPPDHRAAAAEERIARVLDAVGEAERAGDFAMGRFLRDILSAPIMINNDRILANAEAAGLMSEPPLSLTF